MTVTLLQKSTDIRITEKGEYTSYFIIKISMWRSSPLHPHMKVEVEETDKAGN